MDILFTIFIAVGAFIVVALFWLAIAWFIAQMAGWPKLAQTYPSRQPWNPECWSWQSAYMGNWWQYRGILRVCADDEALHLSVLFPFSIAHKPLSIPWHELGGKPKKRLLFSGVELRCQRSPDVPIYIRHSLADRLVKAANGAWQYEAGDEG